MKILVSDKLESVGIQKFKDAKGLELDVKTGLSPEELQAIIKDYDALVIRSATKVTSAIIQAAEKLKVIGRAGIGLDNVDIPAATKKGIVVMNTPEGNIITTAEHAIAMMLSLTRNIPQGTSSIKEGRWEKNLQGREIFNKVLGLIGFGKIGSIVADRARGLKMQVIVYDPFVSKDRIINAGCEPVSLDDLYKRSDYITIHVPKMKETKNLLNKTTFEKMKKGVMIVNCARGGIINEPDLVAAMESGQVAGAALDVFEKEPPENNPLLKLKNFVGTPHWGASTFEAQTNVAIEIADQIVDYLLNGTIRNAVNVPSVTGDLLKTIGPYLSLVEGMGTLHARLAKGAITEVVIEYTGDFGTIDLAPIKTSFLKALLTPAVQYAVNFVNAISVAEERGIKTKEVKSAKSDDFINMITIKVINTEGENTVSGTIFGKKDARIVRINDFRMEMIPQGHWLLITNQDKPGAIGSVGVTLGKHKINIGAMQVGQTSDGGRNIILIRVDTPVPVEVVNEISELSLITSVKVLEL